MLLLPLHLKILKGKNYADGGFSIHERQEFLPEHAQGLPERVHFTGKRARHVILVHFIQLATQRFDSQSCFFIHKLKHARRNRYSQRRRAMKDWFSARELAGLPGLPRTQQNVTARAKREDWQSRKRSGRGGGLEYHLSSLPAETQKDLILRHTPAQTTHHIEPPELSEAEKRRARRHQPLTQRQRESLWSSFSRKPGSCKARGKHALEAVQLYFNLCEQADAAREAKKHYQTRAQIECSVADHAGVSIPTVRNWKLAVKGIHPSDWWPVLTPKYAGRTATTDISPEAWDWFKADYLRLEAPASAACYERLMRIAPKSGWKVPHLRTIERKIKRELPRAVVTLARQGQEAVTRSYPHQERDRSVFHALEAVNADGHKFDVFVRWPDGEIVRPMMCAWQDIYSGKMLSYRVDKSENSDSIRLSFGDMVDCYGVPADAFLDNGRGFASKWMTGGTPTRYRFKIKEEEPTGIMTTLNVKIHWCTPYHGQAKPIERAFRDLCEYVAKHPRFAGAYTGNNPTAKPENYGSKAIDLDVFLKVLEQEIAAHNARTGRTGGLTNGRSFDQVFSESYARTAITKPTREQRRLWMLAAEGVSVRRMDGTIHMRFDKRNRYWDEALEEYAGHKVIVRFDPQYLHDPVHVYTLDNRFICTAICLEAEGFKNTEAAREHAKNKKRFTRATRDQLLAERRMTALEAASMLPDIPDADVPNPKVVRMHKPEVDIPAPHPSTVSDEAVAESAAEVRQIMADEASPLAMFGRDPARDFGMWERLDARASAGEQLAGRELDIWKTYPLSDEYQVIVETKALFAAENGN